jgi:hypothetical protein
VENGGTETVEFHGPRGETLCCRFLWTDRRLRREDVAVDVSGTLLPGYFLTDRGVNWQINTKLPSGMAAGTHAVRVRTRSSGWSNALDIRICKP